jgi:hypothetical protein
MILAGWLFIGLLVASGFLSLRDWFRSKRCQKHGGFGRCRRCDEDAALKSRAEAEERAEAERKRLDITKIFQNMDEKLRAELTAIVMERAERLHLLVGSDGLEAAVVRLYRKRQRQSE